VSTQVEVWTGCKGSLTFVDMDSVGLCKVREGRKEERRCLQVSSVLDRVVEVWLERVVVGCGREEKEN